MFPLVGHTYSIKTRAVARHYLLDLVSWLDSAFETLSAWGDSALALEIMFSTPAISGELIYNVSSLFRY